MIPRETVSMRTRDGVRLDADIYRPPADGVFPVLLMRQPYGRGIASTICYAHPSWYAAQGYIVVVQDVRGRGTSEGKFRLFADDVADGADTVRWAAALPGASGAVGMYGFSYQGTNQLLAAASGVSELAAIAPAMIGWDLAADWAYENDAFCLAGNLGWAIQMGAENARLAGDRAAFDAFFQASRAVPFHASVAARPDAIEPYQRYMHYQDWLDNPPGSPYWRMISPAALAQALRLPMLFIGGWHDSHLPGTLAAFRHFAAAARPVRIVVGPWSHFPWGRRVAGKDFGPEAALDVDRLQIRWFDHWLKGKDTGLLAEPALRLFDMGSREWREFSAWPETAEPLFLTATGRASIDETDGRLSRTVPEREGCDFIVHDPWRPAPAIGGAYGNPPGPVDRSGVDTRPDVLTFTAAALEARLLLAGDVTATLWLTSDSASFDLSCTLSRVTPDGQAMPLAQGYRRVKDGSDLAAPIAVPMRATCATLALGERLRLSIAAACFPAYPVNPGTGADPAATPTSEARIITLGIRHGGRHASRISVGIG
jgi:putative CocE/NonD family hydrolase